MKRYIFLLSIFLAFPVFADSYYSSIGLGMPQYYASAKSAGMGGTSISLMDPMVLNAVNPAAMNIQGFTTVALDFQLENTNIQNSAASVNTSDGNAIGFRFAFPIKRYLNFLVALKPHLSSKYKVSSAGTINDSDAYTRTIDGHGGVSAGVLGVQYIMNDRLAMSFLTNFYFGSYYEEYGTDFESSFYKDGKDLLISHSRGLGFELGLLGRVTSNLFLGAIYKTASDLDTETTTSLGAFYTTEPQFQSLSYPQAFGLGAALRINKVVAAIDFYTQRWSGYELDGVKVQDLANYWRIGTGLEYVDSKLALTRYYRRIFYRAGFYHAQLPFKSATGDVVTEQFISAGLGFPFHNNGGRVDLAIEYGFRGDLETTLYKEKLLRISASISGGELWFQRPVR